jgi:hypothetical protein
MVGDVVRGGSWVEPERPSPRCDVERCSQNVHLDLKAQLLTSYPRKAFQSSDPGSGYDELAVSR